MDRLLTHLISIYLMVGYGFGSDFNCSTIPSSEVVSCGGASVNASFCRMLGCCFNGSATNVNLRCYTRRGGQCMMYQGRVCQKPLNETLTNFTDTPRFFDNAFGQILTENFLQLVMRVIAAQVPDRKCNYILKNMLCHYTLPPCLPDLKTPREFCREDCEKIFEDCSAPINKVIGAVTFIVDDKNIDFVHTTLPNCSRHKYSRDSDSCIHTGFFAFEEQSQTTSIPTTISGEKDRNSVEEDRNSEDGKGQTNILVIIVPVVIAAILIILIVVFVLRRRHRKKKKDALVRTNTLTMREKLRAESLKSLDSRLLRLFDPTKMKQYSLDYVNYVKNLGEGHFGKVFQGSAKGVVEAKSKQEIQVAVKALKEGSSKELKDEFYQEVALMSILNHPNIIRLLAVSTEEEPYGMIFEFMCNGDLNQYLRSAKPAEKRRSITQTAKVYLSQEDLRYFAVQVAEGMQYLANMKFVHRDLATRNCLVGENHVVKIGDFGMSRDLYTSEYYKMSKETLLPIRWLAPEAFLYGKFSTQSDVYAFGVLLWEIFTFGLQPYYGYTNREVTEFIKKEVHLGKPADCSDFIYNIMKDCWHREPADRHQFSTIVERLKDPYGSYDVPPPQAEAEAEAETEAETSAADAPDAGVPDHGNYDVPTSPTGGDLGNYDVPRSNEDLQEHSNYDVPRSPTEEDDDVV